MKNWYNFIFIKPYKPTKLSFRAEILVELCSIFIIFLIIYVTPESVFDFIFEVFGISLYTIILCIFIGIVVDIVFYMQKISKAKNKR